MDEVAEKATPKVEHRSARRYLVDWRTAIVYTNGAGEDAIFHGRACDISTTGIAVYVDRNVFIESPVVLLLAPPSLRQGVKQEVIEVRSRMVYTILAPRCRGFRIGLRFLQFLSNGKDVLQTNLDQRPAC